MESGFTALALRIERTLESRLVRLLILVLIVASVVPAAALDEHVAPVFLVVFGLELTGRITLMVCHVRYRRVFDWLLVTVDIAAFLSFLPQSILGELATPFRLVRLLLLLRFARALSEDLYTVLTRREQLQQFGLVTVAVITLAFASAVALSLLGIQDASDPNLGSGADFWDRMWWAFRQIESPDNLIPTLHPHDPSVLVLSLFLTISGVFLVSFIIGLGANIVEQVVRAERRRPIPHHGHTLVLGAVEDGAYLVREFVRIYEKNAVLRRLRIGELFLWAFRGGPRPRRHALPRIALLGKEHTPPAYLLDPSMRWVTYRQGQSPDGEALSLVRCAEAKRAIVLANPRLGHDADAVSIAALTTFRDQNPDGQVFVEVLQSQNEPLVRSVGGPGTFSLDVPKFLGAFLSQHLVVPGVEAVYRNLLTATGSELYTHVFVETRELSTLAAWSQKEQLCSFSMLAREARQAGLVLIGVLVGEGAFGRTAKGLIPIDNLTLHLNPHGEDDLIRIDSLRGLVAQASSYLPLRVFARRLLRRAPSTQDLHAKHESPQASGPEDTSKMQVAIRLSATVVRRVLVVGYSPALGPFLKTLAASDPGGEVTVAIGDRSDGRMSLRERLGLLDLGLDIEQCLKDRRATVWLGHDGLPTQHKNSKAPTDRTQVTLCIHTGANLTEFAMNQLSAGPEIPQPLDAAVFLSDPDSPDRDARTLLRVLRFAEALEAGDVPRGAGLHIMAEFVSEKRGRRLESELEARRCGFKDADALHVTLLSTDRLKSYFMVHSAFVPGVTQVYETLLRPRGQGIFRVELDEGPGATLTAKNVLDALQHARLILLAIDQPGKGLTVSATLPKSFQPGDGLFVLGDRKTATDTGLVIGSRQF